MSRNTLAIGDRRFGQLLGEESAESSVSLERTSEGIVLTVWWASSDSGSFVGWFRSSRDFPSSVDEPEPVPPRRLTFRDARGVVGLLGCHKGGYTTNLGGPGTGRVLVQEAVFGAPAPVDFDSVAGLRSTVSHLRSWVRAHSWVHEEDSSGALAYRKELSEDIDLGVWGGVQMALQPVAIVKEPIDPDEIRLGSSLWVQTTTTEPAEWATHLRAPKALRDLLVISAWSDENVMTYSVLHPEDKVFGTRSTWRLVASSRVRDDPPFAERRHLVTYEELGIRGLRQWFELRDRFQRAIDPIVSSISLRSASPAAVLAQVGPGLEALGYELLQRDGMGSKEASGVSFAGRARRILDDIGDLLPFESAGWGDRAASVYNGIKHANRQLPDDLQILNVERECTLIVRAWCAQELGVDSSVLRDRLREDPQAAPWVLA